MLAFNLYCKLPYNQFNNRNSEIKILADLIGRTAGAVAYKLVNFVSLDPKQKLLGRKGATNIGKLDKEIFMEFTENFDNLFYESEQLLDETIKSKQKIDNVTNLIDINKKGDYELREVKVRKNQDYFRVIVMSNYLSTCAITGIAIPELLIASHIKPWSKDEYNRLNPANGICLSATLDKAFDRGLITISVDFRVLFSNQLKKYCKESFYSEEIIKFENRQIFLPAKFLPSEEFLMYHNDVIFKN